MGTISEQFREELQSLLECTQKTLNTYAELEDLHKQGVNDTDSITKDQRLTNDFKSELNELNGLIEQIQSVNTSSIIDDLL